MDDKTLRHHVTEEIDFDPVMDGSEVGVAVKDGVATLLGKTSSLLQKCAAEKAAARVRGVRAIANEITVEPGRAPDTSDEEIALRAANLISWETTLPIDAIQIHIADGRMTLEGEVNWHYQRTRAEDLVSRLQGVRVILNHITIKPVVHQMDVRTRIKDALRRNADVEAGSIHVIVDDGTVTLQGDVNGWHEKEIAETAAWSALGVTDVIDQLRIS